ncbi:hypothetical protein [Streptomyces sp. Y1]|uniref:Lipoprotein n=1 Tax=Streptomyces sp. Y1 TaxID=3238634 RepID=A0AB39TT72_9ACTN
MAIAAMALNACGANPLQDPTMTLAQARKQIDSYQADILANLPIKPRSNSGSFSDLECGANDNGPHGREQTWRSATFEDLPLPGRAQAAAAFRTYLTGRGFQLASDSGGDIGWVKLKNPKDGFVAILDGAGDTSRTFSLEVISPCVWPNGTPSA